MGTWWHHQMETFFTLLVLCAGNSLVTSEFPSQRPVTQSFDVSFDLCLNKRLSKQSWGWWFQMPSCSLWRHCNVYSITKHCVNISIWYTDVGTVHKVWRPLLRPKPLSWRPPVFSRYSGGSNFCRRRMSNEHQGILKNWQLDCLFNSFSSWQQRKRQRSALVALCKGNPLVTSGFPWERASNVESISMWWWLHYVSSLHGCPSQINENLVLSNNK